MAVGVHPQSHGGTGPQAGEDVLEFGPHQVMEPLRLVEEGALRQVSRLPPLELPLDGVGPERGAGVQPPAYPLARCPAVSRG